ncbi:hypothetical protein V5279_18835 [Bradyrhizobium sp. 26S5]|uniref:hypothetical protein n=1 Tax=Bradyrhizobium sp. 26S5 TaxID=3139729 RepID=UPI0030CE3A2A
MAIYNNRSIEIATIIKRYVEKHPHAADTSEGIQTWWMPAERKGDSPQDVAAALDYLVETECLLRVRLADGTVIYTHARNES